MEDSFGIDFDRLNDLDKRIDSLRERIDSLLEWQKEQEELDRQANLRVERNIRRNGNNLYRLEHIYESIKYLYKKN